MKKSFLLFACAFFVFFSGAIVPKLYSSDSIISNENIYESYGVIREQRLLDSKVPNTEYPINDFTASLFLSNESFLIFDLNKQTEIQYLQLNSYKNNINIWYSHDGKIL